ncbi:MAG: type 4a pilus biogenesis protein PilO [Acidimicrobiia bacterium]
MVLVTVLWFLFLFTPKSDDLSSAEDQTQALQNEVLSLRGQLGRLRDIEDNRVSYLAAQAGLESSIPLVPNLANLIDGLHLLADDTAVDLQSITPGVPTAVPGVGVTEIVLVLDLQADYFELLGFLYGLEDMERLVKVDALTIDSQEDDAGERVLAVTVTAKAYTSLTVGGEAVAASADGTEEEG